MNFSLILLLEDCNGSCGKMMMIACLFILLILFSLVYSLVRLLQDIKLCLLSLVTLSFSKKKKKKELSIIFYKLFNLVYFCVRGKKRLRLKKKKTEMANLFFLVENGIFSNIK